MEFSVRIWKHCASQAVRQNRETDNDDAAKESNPPEKLKGTEVNNPPAMPDEPPKPRRSIMEIILDPRSIQSCWGSAAL
ncbi:MAG: hypothetical protein U0936_17250 [Planctomycetaceae bacterium]